MYIHVYICLLRTTFHINMTCKCLAPNRNEPAAFHWNETNKGIKTNSGLINFTLEA